MVAGGDIAICSPSGAYLKMRVVNVSGCVYAGLSFDVCTGLISRGEALDENHESWPALTFWG